MFSLCFSGSSGVCGPAELIEIEAALAAPEAANTSPKMTRDADSVSTRSSTRIADSDGLLDPEELRNIKRSAKREGRDIRNISEADFFAEYETGKQVMTSSHRGMFVLFATRISDGASVVVKTLHKGVIFGGCQTALGQWRETMVAQLNMPKSRALCELLDVIETEERVYVVMERIEGQDLQCWAAASDVHCHTACVREITRQILQGVQIMHDNARIHKDLKFENVMLDMDPTVLENSGGLTATIIDFDTAEEWHEGAPRAPFVLGSTGCIAPEAHEGLYSPASDMYSVGVILYRLLTRRFPVDPTAVKIQRGENVVGHPSMKRIQKHIEGAEINFERSAFLSCPQAAALCRSLLAVDPAARLSAEDALAHEWLA